jgi:c-di-GMP-binding flagellar brake protein YcgR
MERREHPRYQVCLEIEIREKNSTFSSRGSTTDVSLGGCYVATIFPFAVGGSVDFTMWMADEPIRGRGVIQTCHPGVGMGIKFNDLSQEVKQRLDQFLRASSPIPTQSILRPDGFLNR